MYHIPCRAALAILLGALLAACGAEAPVADAPATAAAAPTAQVPVSGPERRILAFGDSLFAGYDLGAGEGYPEQLEQALREAGINARVIDAGVSGDTTAAGRQRLEFVLESAGDAPDLAIVELGGNDLLRGLAPEQTRENLTAIITTLKARGIPVLLMGMRAPPNMGPEYQAQFDGLYPALAREHGTALVPFFMEPLFADPALFLPDRIHPTAAGVEALVAATLDEVTAALPTE